MRKSVLVVLIVISSLIPATMARADTCQTSCYNGQLITSGNGAKVPNCCYKIQRGDTLWRISIRYYGTGLKWRLLAQVNNIKNPRKLTVGMVIEIPD